MPRRATPTEDLERFSALPVRKICPGPAGRALAVHVAGDLAGPLPPLVCVPGYVRNMLDFEALPKALAERRAVVLVDLAGRGRSDPLPRRSIASTLSDTEDVLEVATALGIGKAVMLGEGHGGQVIMILARRRPGLIAGAVLCDSGPVIDPRGLVRLRNNLRHVLSLRGENAIRDALRRILAADYPDADETRLDALGERLFRRDPRGRALGLFDPRLIAQLERFNFDDVLEPQWALFACLAHAPLMLMRTALSDQLRRETFAEMARLRPDAATLAIPGQGSPALFDTAATQAALTAFLDRLAPAGEDAA